MSTKNNKLMVIKQEPSDSSEDKKSEYTWLKYLIFLFVLVPDATLLIKATCVSIMFAIAVHLEDKL